MTLTCWDCGHDFGRYESVWNWYGHPRCTTHLRPGDYLRPRGDCDGCARPVMGRTSEPRNGSVWCSDTCRKRARRREGRDRTFRRCAHCHGFLPRSARADARYCSTRCRTAAHRERNRA